MLQTVASLIDDARVVIYDHNMFIIQATGLLYGCRFLSASANIRLTVINTLAYFGTELITATKSFKYRPVIGKEGESTEQKFCYRANLIKLLWNKLERWSL
jgi:hypothetical protein